MNESSAQGAMQSLTSVHGHKIMAAAGSLKRLLFLSLADDAIYPRGSLSLSIDRGTFSAAYGSSFLSKISLKAAKSYPFDSDRPPIPKDVVSSLALFVNEHQIQQRGINLSIPGAWTVVRTAEFPSTVMENLPAVVSYELDRITPFSTDEALYDFQVTRYDGKMIKIMLTAVRAELVTPYLDALSESGYSVASIKSNTSCTGTLCRYAGGKADVVIADMGGQDFECSLFTGGMLLKSLSGKFPVQEDSEKADIVSREIRSLLDSEAVRSSSPPVMTLFRKGSKPMKELISQRLQRPVSAVSESGIKRKFPGLSDEMAYAAAGGVIESLWSDAFGMNLLSRGSRQKRKYPFILSAMLAAAIVIMAVLYIVAPLRFEQERLDRLSSEIESKKEEVRKAEALIKEAESLQTEIDSIAAFKENKTMTLNVLRELTTVLPESAWLSRVKITGQAVDAEGFATKSASEILSKFEASPLLKKAEFASPTVRDARNNSERFVIKMEIEGSSSAEAKPKPAAQEKHKSEKK